MMNEKLKKDYFVFIVLISAGIILRFVAMSLGHNFDFESYCVVGEIAGNFKNVYANTSRYNYGPIFFFIQGTLYRLAQVRPSEWVSVFRILIVSVLTIADLGITAFIAGRYSLKKAAVFFLNPVSIVITGLHNQFDNIAVLFALLSILFYNEEETFSVKDAGFVAMFTISLVTKHILFLVPFFLLVKKGLPLKKKALYAFVPPALFLLSFVPFVIHNQAAFEGVRDNVFLYRSKHNAPLLGFFYNLIGFPERLIFVVYILMMVLLTRFTVSLWESTFFWPSRRSDVTSTSFQSATKVRLSPAGANPILNTGIRSQLGFCFLHCCTCCVKTSHRHPVTQLSYRKPKRQIR